MKKIALIFTFVFLTVKSFADCAGNGLYFWPAVGTVKQNAIFMIEGYANDQSIITGLGTEYAVYLKSGDEKIKLIVKEICVGQFELTQAILAPEKNLTAGKEYALMVDGLEGYVKPFTQWNSETGDFEAVKWTAVSESDVTAPSWTKKPDESEKSYVAFGCGPAVNVHFNFAIYDESPVLLRTTVKNVKSGKSTTYYLDVTNETTVAVGHGMCSGAFYYSDKDGNEYEIGFDILDGSGNVTPWNLEKIKFTKPTALNATFD